MSGDGAQAKVEQLRRISAALGLAADRARQGRDADVDCDEIERQIDELASMLCERPGEVLRGLSTSAATLHSNACRLLNGESASTVQLIGGLLSLRSGIALVRQIQERKRAA